MLQEVKERLDREDEERQRRLQTRLEAEIKAVLESGISQDRAFAEAFAALARPEIDAILEEEESIQIAGNTYFGVMSGEFLPAYLAITDRRALWSSAPDFERVISNLRFTSVDTMSGAPYEHEAQGLRITYSPEDFPEALRQYNPSGQLDATFIFQATEEDEWLRMGLLARGGFPGPRDEGEEAQAVVRLRRQAVIKIPEWDLCPMCCHEMKQSTENAARCGSNRHLFSAPGVEPIIDESEARFGEIVREEPWMPVIEADLQFVGHPLVWVLRPPGSSGPPKILDYEAIQAAFVAS